jgi:hypothetical protein
MSFNKIKIKQIDVDLSGSVYSFGTGFFLQTGVLQDISGTFLSKQDFLNSGVRISGNQDITGVKNFISRPLFNGQNIASFSDSVLRTGSQDISGMKSFRSGVSLYSSNLFFGNVSFYQRPDLSGVFFSTAREVVLASGGAQDITGVKNFISRPNLSGLGLARLSETVWSSGGAQDITGVKNFVSRPNLSGLGLASLSETVWSSGGAQDITGVKNFIARPNLSGLGLARLSETVWSSGGAQDITGVKNFVSNISSPAFSGSGIFSNGSKFAISTNLNTNSVTINIPTGTECYAFASGDFSPAGTTNIRNLGNATTRWKEIFCGNGVINTSDKNLKTDIKEVPDSWLDAWDSVSFKAYKFKNSNNLEEKWHVGLIAQEIFQAFEEKGLNAIEIGLVRYDEINEDHKSQEYYDGMTGIWSIASQECQFMEAALTRRKIKNLEKLL